MQTEQVQNTTDEVISTVTNATGSPDQWIDHGINFITEFGPKVIGAILIWIIGSWVIGKIMKVASGLMDKRGYDISLKGFLSSLLGAMLKILLILTILGTLGVETTSFAAILAAAGLAIGMALQGSLSNFAGGVMLMIFKPFKIGDLIEGQGVTGVVQDIQIFTTSLITPDGKQAIVPNGTLSNGNILNYSTTENLRVDLSVGIGYDENIKTAKEVILKAVLDTPGVLQNPAPTVAVSALGESSVDLVVRPHTTVDKYWDVYFQTQENVKNALDAANIEIPYPHSVEIQKAG